MKNLHVSYGWISKITPTKQFFRPFQRVSSPSSRRSPFKQRDKSLWLLPEINRESLWLKYAPSNNFGLLFRKSHFHIKLYPKNMWHRVIFQRRWYPRSNKKADRTDTADFTEGPLRELSKHSKPPITSPHRPNMSEVVAFVGISQRDILSRRNMISYQQSKAERSHATSNTPKLVTTRDRCTNRINFKKRPLLIRSFLQKPIILWPLYSLYNFEFLTSHIF